MTMTKEESHSLVVKGVLRETFVSVDYPFTVDISALREQVLANPTKWETTVLMLDAEAAKFLFDKREIDEERVLNLTEEELLDPVFVSTFVDPAMKGVCPIDGHHRMVKLWRRRQGHTVGVRAYVIPWNELPKADPAKPEVTWGSKVINPDDKCWVPSPKDKEYEARVLARSAGCRRFILDHPDHAHLAVVHSLDAAEIVKASLPSYVRTAIASLRAGRKSKDQYPNEVTLETGLLMLSRGEIDLLLGVPFLLLYHKWAWPEDSRRPLALSSSLDLSRAQENRLLHKANSVGDPSFRHNLSTGPSSKELKSSHKTAWMAVVEALIKVDPSVLGPESDRSKTPVQKVCEWIERGRPDWKLVKDYPPQDNQKIIFFEDGSMDMGVYREADHQDWVKANSVWVPAPPKPQSIQSILFKYED